MIIRENISFERGKDPRDAMGIGDELAITASSLGMEYVFAITLAKTLGMFLAWDMDYDEFEMNLYHIVHELTSSELREYGLHPEDQNFETLQWADHNIKEAWEIFKAAKSWRKRNHGRIKRSDLAESISFERGRDPKSSMNMGLNPFPIIGMATGTGDYVLGNDLRLIFEALIKDPGYIPATNQTRVKYLKSTGDPAHKFLTTVQSEGYGGIKWAHLFLPFERPTGKARRATNESVNFERGQTPKDSMKIGNKYADDVAHIDRLTTESGKTIDNAYDVRKFFQNIEMGLYPANFYVIVDLDEDNQVMISAPDLQDGGWGNPVPWTKVLYQGKLYDLG